MNPPSRGITNVRGSGYRADPLMTYIKPYTRELVFLVLLVIPALLISFSPIIAEALKLPSIVFVAHR